MTNCKQEQDILMKNIKNLNYKKNSIMEFFNEGEEKQSLHRLNNKQKSIDVMEKSFFRLFGYNQKNYNQSIKSGFFFTETKKNFDISIIISNDPERKQWYLLNLTKSEIHWLAKQELASPVFAETIELLLYTVYQFNVELLLTFKNSTKNYSQITFNYVWLGITDLDEDEILYTDWKLNYT